MFDRNRLFSLMNDLPSVFEVVTGRKPIKDKPTVDSGSKSRGSSKVKAFTDLLGRSENAIQHNNNSLAFLLAFALQRSNDGQMKSNSKILDEINGEDDEEHSETLCGSCGGNYNSDEFWICCDICERWYHGKCVKITPAKAESIKQYKCPSCNTKRGRQ